MNLWGEEEQEDQRDAGKWSYRAVQSLLTYLLHGAGYYLKS